MLTFRGSTSAINNFYFDRGIFLNSRSIKQSCFIVAKKKYLVSASFTGERQRETHTHTHTNKPGSGEHKDKLRKETLPSKGVRSSSNEETRESHR
jgi:hypothetical protein